MKRHLATAESIAALREFRSARKGARNSKAPENSGLTKDEAKRALLTIGKSGHKIPAKLLPKAPS
jgi:hypothetical protein